MFETTAVGEGMRGIFAGAGGTFPQDFQARHIAGGGCSHLPAAQNT